MDDADKTLKAKWDTENSGKLQDTSRGQVSGVSYQEKLKAENQNGTRMNADLADKTLKAKKQ